MTTTINASTTAGLVQTADTSGLLALQTAGTTAITVDASPNMGLGVTPSAWRNTFKALQILGTATLSSNANTAAYFGSNWYTDSGGTDRYIANGQATIYGISAGVHAWYNAPSGTAGNAISFTQAMTLNTNGVLALQGASTSANGVGITFPATQSASTDANTLDDYEEGTWTPTITGTGTAGTATYAQRSARYTKVGRLVYVELYLSWSSGTGTSSLIITGLPFTSANANDFPSMSIGFSDGLSFTGQLVGYIEGNSTQINLGGIASGAAFTTLAYDGAGQILVAGSYTV